MEHTPRRALTERELIEAWYSNSSLEVIGRRFGVSRKWIAMSWKLLKMHGKLPDENRTCQNAGLRQQVGNGSRAEAGDPLAGESGQPTVLWAPDSHRDRWTEDPLLARLRQEHGPCGRPDIYDSSKR